MLLLQVLIFNFQFSIVAQREADCLAMGYCDYSLPNCHPSYGSAIYKFNEEGIEYIEEDARLSLSTAYSRAAFSDRHTGELIFASNGWRLVNRSGQVLAHKLWRDDIPHPGNTFDSTGVLNSQGPLFLNDPGDSTKAYLFYGQHRLDDFGTPIGFATYDVLFTYAYLDIPTQSLISKNNVLLNELSAAGDAQACRHANGRDWWLIKPGQYEDEYHIGILNPQGISLEKKTIQGLPHREQTLTYTYFNQDGNKILHFIPLYSELQSYDFDRCSGTLSNLVVHDLRDSLRKDTTFIDFNACNISPDGTKFYVRRSGRGTLQYDLGTGVFTDLNYETSAPQLTPNYKQILFSTRILNNGSSIRTLSTIYEPNKPGLECNFVLHTDTIINIANFINPSCFANFRLGKLEGSPCDTIVSGMGEVKAGRVKVYPNPARDVITVELEQAANYQINIYNALGQRVYFARTAGKSKIIDLSNLPLHSGLLLVEVMNEENNQLYKMKVIYE